MTNDASSGDDSFEVLDIDGSAPAPVVISIGTDHPKKFLHTFVTRPTLFERAEFSG